MKFLSSKNEFDFISNFGILEFISKADNILNEPSFLRYKIELFLIKYTFSDANLHQIYPNLDLLWKIDFIGNYQLCFYVRKLQLSRLNSKLTYFHEILLKTIAIEQSSRKIRRDCELICNRKASAFKDREGISDVRPTRIPGKKRIRSFQLRKLPRQIE